MIYRPSFQVTSTTQKDFRSKSIASINTAVDSSATSNHHNFDNKYLKGDNKLQYPQTKVQYVCAWGNLQTRRTINEELVRQIQRKNRSGSYVTTSKNVEVVTNLGSDNIPQYIESADGKEKIRVTRYIIKQESKAVNQAYSPKKYNLYSAGTFVSGGNGVCEASTHISLN